MAVSYTHLDVYKRQGQFYMVFTRPLAAALAIFTVFSFVFPLVKIAKEKKKKKAEEGQALSLIHICQLQKNAGCERIHVDHCIDRLTAQIWMDSLQMERSYRYE